MPKQKYNKTKTIEELKKEDEANEGFEANKNFNFLNFFKWLKPEYMPWWLKIIAALGFSFLIAAIFYWGMYTGFSYGYDAALAHISSNYQCVPIGKLNFTP